MLVFVYTITTTTSLVVLGLVPVQYTHTVQVLVQY